MSGIEKLQEQVSFWDQYYKEHFGWETANELDGFVSELLFSPHIDLRLEQLKAMKGCIPFDCDDCYVIVTGVPRRYYTDMFGWNYLDMCMFFYDSVLPEFVRLSELYGFSGVAFIDPKGWDRNINYVISLKNSTVSVEKVAKEITVFLQEEYEQRLFCGDQRIKCFTVLSRKVNSRYDLMKCFLEADRLKTMSFFRMEPIVFEPIEFERSYRRVDNVLLNDFKAAFSTALYSGNKERVSTCIRELFLGELKVSFDFWAVDVALRYCWDALFAASMTYNQACCPEFERSQFCSVEECCNALIKEAKRICETIIKSGTNLSYISREALYYIHTHYTSPISLDNIAEYINVVPSYVSRVFRRELGENIVKYINTLRIENAKSLLENTEEKIKHVGEKVGIPNVKYFSQLFRIQTGLTPQEYRKRFHNQ